MRQGIAEPESISRLGLRGSQLKETDMKIFGKIFSSVGGAWNAIGRHTAVLRREYVIEHYLRAGARFGDALAKLYIGDCIPLDAVRRRFAQFERRYAALGYRTIKLDDFIEYGAYGKSISHLLRIKRDASEA